MSSGAPCQAQSGVGDVDGLPGHGRLGRRGLAQGCASRVDGPKEWSAPNLGIEALVRPWRVGPERSCQAGDGWGAEHANFRDRDVPDCRQPMTGRDKAWPWMAGGKEVALSKGGV